MNEREGFDFLDAILYATRPYQRSFLEELEAFQGNVSDDGIDPFPPKRRRMRDVTPSKLRGLHLGSMVIVDDPCSEEVP